MEINHIWSIVGITISAGFGIWGIYIAIRHRYPGRITFVTEQIIELFDDIGDTLPGLSVTYNNDEVSKNLVLLNGALINTGSIDISQSNIEKPISLRLPDDFKWLNAKIINTSSDLNANVEITEDGNIVFDVGLFRKKEYIRFHALAEVPLGEADKLKSSSKLLSNAISFYHRITNTRKIDTSELDVISKRRFRRFLIPVAMIFLVGVGMLIFIQFVDKSEALGFNYLTNQEKSEPIMVTAKIEDGQVKLRSTTDETELSEPLEVFWGKVTGLVIVDDKKYEIMVPLILVAYVGIPLLFLVFLFISRRRTQRLLRILEIET